MKPVDCVCEVVGHERYRQRMSRRGKKLRQELGVFLRKYSRQSQSGQEPNDRSYDRQMERLIKQMKPEDLDALMRGEDEEPSP